ncbi:hypothetical protein [Streptomyces sp. TS71-3]|uniref:hypothetical protein n=1 Tax=Streptomyces sp. TS71-3 TaxID=2733862 RepID=UPI001B1F955C|nr:hypothetical protein [Streptomyces sp. TS71-3]GHJ34456.1 hypothetical protein Sm713_00650 [Streptomyces sp. TS71-3]
MAISDDLRKTLTNPTPLYFAAGTADLALQQAKKIPGLVEQFRAEAPGRFEAVRRTDPREVQNRATARAKDVQSTLQTKVNGIVGQLDIDLKKLGESAQGMALRGVGVAVEYAVKARETYEKVAEHGEQTVRTWRGETAGDPAPAVVGTDGTGKPGPVVVKDAAKDEADEPKSAAPKAPKASPSTSPSTSATAKKAAAKKPATPRNGTKKTTPPAK